MYDILRCDNGELLDSVARDGVLDALHFWHGRGIPCFARPV